MNAPRHPLEAQLVEKLLPSCCAWSAIDREKHALGIARTLLELWEREHRQR